jgi:3-methyladenine DNA glycosylase/8-oxoguanine DNA glycosylase
MARLRKRFSFQVRPESPYDFLLTVRKPSGWPLFTPDERFSGKTLWTALRIGGNLVGLKLSSEGSVARPRIKAEVFMDAAPGPAGRGRISDAIENKLYAREGLAEFYRFASRDPILRHAIRHRYGMQDTDGADLFSSAVLAVCLQMAPLKRSNEMMGCLLRVYGETAEFDGKRVAVWPSPKTMAAVKPAELKKECRLGYRAEYVVGIARILGKGGFPGLEELRLMKPDAAKAKLMELPGIGDYSADIMNPHGGFPIDVWSADVFGKLFFGREPPGRGGIAEVKAEGLRRWGKWSWLAFLYVVQDLENLSDKLGIRLRLS